MVTAKLMGGLGNQMFQMAAAYGFAKKIGTDCAFDFKGCWTPNQGYPSIKYRGTFFREFNELEEWPNEMVYWSEPNFSYSEIPTGYGNMLCLNGYFQSEKYFKDYKLEIKKMFEFPVELKLRVIRYIIRELHKYPETITSIHVRRGDYLKESSKGFHTLLNETSYYEKAMDLIGGNFVIISDDIEWCKKNIKGPNIFYSPFTDELEDLFLMTYCEHQIIANSSFSWWGAYLKNKMIENSKVIAPENWFGPNGPKDTQDLIPENWIKI